MFYFSSKIYDKRDDVDFDIVNFSLLYGDVPHVPFYSVHISNRIRITRVCSHLADFNARNKTFTAKLLKQGYLYHELRRAFSTFPVSILRKSISGRHRPVRVADGPMAARCRFT